MNEIKISLLICSIERRKEQLTNLISTLENQANKLSNKNLIEILTEIDNEVLSIGTKRNLLIQRARGEYLVFIDDDDNVCQDYLSNIFQALSSSPDCDCIGYKAKILHHNKWYTVNYSLKNKEKIWNHSTLNVYTSIFHINPIKASIVKKYKFSDKFWEEDVDFMKNILHELKKEIFIDHVMYFYTPSNEDLLKIIKDKRRQVEIEE